MRTLGVGVFRASATEQRRGCTPNLSTLFVVAPRSYNSARTATAFIEYLKEKMAADKVSARSYNTSRMARTKAFSGYCSAPPAHQVHVTGPSPYCY